MPCTRSLPAAWVACAVLWASPSAAAEPLELSWQAPPGCPQESAVREQIRALVPSAMLESGRLKAEGAITRVDKRFRLNLVLHLGELSGARTIESDSCSDLAGAAAVAVGLLLQSATQAAAPDGATAPGAASESGSASPSPAADPGNPVPSATANAATPTGAATPAATPPAAAPAVRLAQPRTWRVFLQAPQLGVDLGPMPEPSVGLVLAVGFSVPHWRFAASFELPRSQHLSLPGSSGAGAELQHWAVESWTCRAWHAERFELAPCLLIGWDRLKASGTGPDVTGRSERVGWLSVGAAALGRWYVADWFALAASVGAKVESARPTISIDGLSEDRRLERVALTFRAGPVWIF